MVRLKFLCVSGIRVLDSFSLMCILGWVCRKFGSCGVICWCLSVIGVVMCIVLCGVLVRLWMLVKVWLICLKVLCVDFISLWLVLVSWMLCVVCCIRVIFVVCFSLVMCWFIVVLFSDSCCVVVV